MSTEFPPLPDFNERSGVPSLPDNKSGFPPLPKFNENSGFPPLLNGNEQSGFPPLPKFNEQSGFPPLPTFNESSFPCPPDFNVSGEDLISLAFPTDFPAGHVEFPPLPFNIGRALPDINVNEANFPPLPDFNSAHEELHFPALPDFSTGQSQSADPHRPLKKSYNFPPLPDFAVS